MNLKLTLVALVSLALGAALALLPVGQRAPQSLSASTRVTGKALIGGPFSLIDQTGKRVTDEDFKGRYLLVYFGYTFCPDLCPTGLQSIARVLDQLGTDAAKVAPLFITIDPTRDTAEKLKAYVAAFHPQIEGLTGTDQQVAEAAAAYQVYYTKGEAVDDHDYMMDHSSLIYLMGSDGKFITTFPEDVDAATIVKAIQSQKEVK